jgi:hypothetical protein
MGKDYGSDSNDRTMRPDAVQIARDRQGGLGQDMQADRRDTAHAGRGVEVHRKRKPSTLGRKRYARSSRLQGVNPPRG